MNTNTLTHLHHPSALRRVFASVVALLLAAFLCGCIAPLDDEADGASPSVAEEAGSEPEVAAQGTDDAGGSGQEDATDTDGNFGSAKGTSSVDPDENEQAIASDANDSGTSVTEDGEYTSKDEVALYIHLYGHLPSNFISKTKAKEAGWVSSEGNLDEVCPGMSIGGSQFYNDDGLLPDAKGRTWKECDINYHGGYRGAERIVFSNDGLVYYTGDHYSSFERLY